MSFDHSISPICSHDSGIYCDPIEISLSSPYLENIEYIIKYNTNQLYDLSNLNDGHCYTKSIKISRTTILKYIGVRDGLYQISTKESKIFVLKDIEEKTPIAFIGSCLAKGLSNRCTNLDKIFEILIANNHTAFLLNDCYINENMNICGYSNSNYASIFNLLKPNIFLHSSPLLYKSSQFVIKKEFMAIEGFVDLYNQTKFNNKLYVIINGPLFDNNIKTYSYSDIESLKHNKFYKVHENCLKQINNKSISFISIVDFFATLITEKLVDPQDIFGYDQNHYTNLANEILLYWFFNVLKINTDDFTDTANKINNDNILKFIEGYEYE